MGDLRLVALFLSALCPIKQGCNLQFYQIDSIRIKENFKMKFSTIFLAGPVSADEKKVPPRHPLQRLKRLVQFSDEILSSGALNNKSGKWIERWTNKFAKNAGRMETSFTRGNQRCGFYDKK